MSNSRTNQAKLKNSFGEEKYIARASVLYSEAKDDFSLTRYSDAKEKSQRACKILQETLYTYDYALLANCYGLLGLIHQQQNDLAEAQIHYKRAAAACCIGGQLWADKKPNIPMSLYAQLFLKLAQVAFEKGDLEKALEYASNLLNASRKQAESNVPLQEKLPPEQVAPIYFLLGQIEEKRGEDAAALQHYKCACAIQKEATVRLKTDTSRIRLAEYAYAAGRAALNLPDDLTNPAIEYFSHAFFATVEVKPSNFIDPDLVTIRAHIGLANGLLRVMAFGGQVSSVGARKLYENAVADFASIPECDRTDLDYLARFYASLNLFLDKHSDTRANMGNELDKLHKDIHLLCDAPLASPFAESMLAKVYEAFAAIGQDRVPPLQFELFRYGYNVFSDNNIDYPLRKLYAFKHQGALLSGRERMSFNRSLLVLVKLMHKVIQQRPDDPSDRFEEVMVFFKDANRVNAFTAELEKTIKEANSLQELTATHPKTREAFTARVHEAIAHREHLTQAVAEFQRTHPGVSLPPALSLFAPRSQGGAASAEQPAPSSSKP